MQTERKTSWPGPPFWLQDGTPVSGAAWLFSCLKRHREIMEILDGGGGVELEEPEFESEPCYLRAVPTLGESLKHPEPQLSHL